MSHILYDIPKRIASLFVIFLLLYEFSTYIANDMIMPGMIYVIRSFHATDSMVSASLTAYILGGASLQLILGPISDRFGRRPVMLVGAFFFLLCSIIIAISQSIDQFILARFFQGMGLCFISVVGYATLHEVFNEIHAVRLISIMNNITILAPLAGPLIGAIVIHYFGWRSVFIIISMLALTSLVGLWLYMPEIVGKKRLDGSENERTPLNFTTVLGNYSALFKNKRFMMGSIANGAACVPIIAWIGTSPLILIKQAHMSVIHFGLWQIPIFIFVTFGNYLMRLLTHHVNLVRLSNIGSGIMVLSLLLTSILPILFNNHYLALIVGLSCYAIGLGFIGAPITRLTLFSTIIPKGTASALMSMIGMLLMATGNQLGGWVYATQNNTDFGLFCGLAGLVYLISFLAMK